MKAKESTSPAHKNVGIEREPITPVEAHQPDRADLIEDVPIGVLADRTRDYL